MEGAVCCRHIVSFMQKIQQHRSPLGRFYFVVQFGGIISLQLTNITGSLAWEDTIHLNKNGSQSSRE